MVARSSRAGTREVPLQIAPIEAFVAVKRTPLCQFDSAPSGSHFRPQGGGLRTYFSRRYRVPAAPSETDSCQIGRFAANPIGKSWALCMPSDFSPLLKNLNRAEAALRQNLHTHCLNATARHHMERATSHIREAYIAINEPGRARSVADLLNDLAAGERFIAHAVAKASKAD